MIWYSNLFQLPVSGHFSVWLRCNSQQQNSLQWIHYWSTSGSCKLMKSKFLMTHSVNRQQFCWIQELSLMSDNTFRYLSSLVSVIFDTWGILLAFKLSHPYPPPIASSLTTISSYKLYLITAFNILYLQYTVSLFLPLFTEEYHLLTHASHLLLLNCNISCLFSDV